MNNDLISREALIEAITSETRNEFEFICLSRLFEIIDNAPTVEITEEQAIDKLHETGWLQEHDKQMTERPQDDLIKAFELLKAHCKNRECNKDCVFYRELRVGDNTEQFCGLCEIVMSDERGEEE